MRQLISASAVWFVACTSVYGSILHPIVVDGRLDHDWGVVVADGISTHHVGGNYSGLRHDIGLQGYHQEDQDDLAGGGGFLGPNSGGQNYDAEFMGVALQGTKLFIAIVTGQRPDNGPSQFGPGDIRIVTDHHVYGIEVGGGAGVKEKNPTGAIEEGAPGSTYNLDRAGFTMSLAVTNPLQTAGSIWRDPNWIDDPIPPTGPVQLWGGALVGMADYTYTRDSFTKQHAIIELSLATQLFGADTIRSVYWRPGCGNDELNVQNLRVVTAPEPGSLCLSAMGIIGLASYGGRRRRPAGRSVAPQRTF